MALSRNIHTVTVAVEDDTPVELVVETEQPWVDRPCYDRIHIGGLTLWPGYLSNDDSVVVTACDRLIDALQEVRAHALQRLAKAEPKPEPYYRRGHPTCEWAYAERADCADYRIRFGVTRPCPAHGALPAAEAAS